MRRWKSMQKEKRQQYLALHILDTLESDPLGTFVAFSLSDEAFLLLTRVEARDDRECYWRRERATCWGWDTWDDGLVIRHNKEQMFRRVPYHVRIACDSWSGAWKNLIKNKIEQENTVNRRWVHYEAKIEGKDCTTWKQRTSWPATIVYLHHLGRKVQHR